MMQTRAKSLLVLSTELKDRREQITPLREDLIREMAAAGVKRVVIGDKTCELVSKRARKAVGIKKVMTIAADQLGPEAAKKLKDAVDASRVQGDVKHSLKITDTGDSAMDEEVVNDDEEQEETAKIA